MPHPQMIEELMKTTEFFAKFRKGELGAYKKAEFHAWLAENYPKIAATKANWNNKVNLYSVQFAQQGQATPAKRKRDDDDDDEDDALSPPLSSGLKQPASAPTASAPAANK